MSNASEDLKRGLEERHISLMALGAAIGVGLFLGSATSIHLAGPAILISYLVCGLAIFVIMRALGEMAIHKPVAGSFCRYAQDYFGPLTGYLTGWTYWLVWIATCMAEFSAIGVYMHMWYPDVPTWIWALSSLVILGCVNFLTVKLYGEFEFWFALIKVITIILMIVLGLGTIIFGLGNGGVATGLQNLWVHGGFMPNGISGFMLAMPMVAFAYAGVEMIGLTAGEAKNPTKSLSRAVNSVFWRILIFYFGALFVILSIYPWNEVGTQGSPFVMMFDRMSIPRAAGIVNFVVLTAALSSCNSGIFSTGRMLFNLAHQKHAASAFGKTGRSGVPRRAIFFSAALLFIGVVLNYVAPTKVFGWLTSISTFASIWTWGVILLAHIKFRRTISSSEIAAMPIRMRLFPYASYCTLLFLVAILIVMAFRSETRVALVVGAVWIVFLVATYFVRSDRKATADAPVKVG